MKINALSKQFNSGKLVLFALPTVVMMVFLSMYTAVDGAFVSNYVGEDALSAINIVFPFINIFIGLATMFATGGNAIIARKMGAGDVKTARAFFTLLYIVGFIIGVVIALIGYFGADGLLKVLASTPRLDAYGKQYLQIMSLFAPLCFMQVFTQVFFVTAGKPIIGLSVTILGGMSNILFDYIFIGVAHLGVAGAAYATGIGYVIPGVFGIIYFLFNRKQDLHYSAPCWDFKGLLKTCTNGSSELVTNLAMAVTTLLFNWTMLKYIGESGVAAITVIMYVQFIQSAIYMGYSQGVAPVISYKYGAGDTPQLNKIIKTSLMFITAVSILIITISMFCAEYAVALFVNRSSSTFDLTVHGFKIFAIAYVFMGFNIFASSMFTAFGNGIISALLSFMRTLVFIVGALLVLPLILGVEGIWWAVPLAEALAVIISIVCFFVFAKRYTYNFWQHKRGNMDISN